MGATPLSFYTKAKGSGNMAKEEIETKQEFVDIPDTNIDIPPLPDVGSPENTIIIGGKLIEIKPTKLKYQRNGTTVFYHALELYPLADIFAMDSRVFGAKRGGDKALIDWLVAVTDDEQLIRENYDDMDTDTIYRLLAIWKRVNKIDEKESKLKNMQAPSQTKD